MGWRLWYLSVFNMGGLLFVFDVMGIVFYGWVRVAFPSFRCVFSLLCFDWQVFMPSLLRCYAWITTCDESDMGASACELGLEVPWMSWWRVRRCLWYVCSFDMNGFLVGF